MKRKLLALLLAAAMTAALLPVLPRETAATSLPSGYVAVEYVASHGTEFIDLGFAADSALRAEIDYQLSELRPSTYAGVFGAYATGNRFCVMVNSSGKESVSLGGGYYMQTATAARKTVAIDNAAVTVELNGSAAAATDGAYSVGTPAQNLCVFAYKSGDGTVRCSSCRVYGLEIYESGVLEHEYVPCFKEATSEYGLYDLEDGVFLGNASGSGALSGPPVVLPLPAGYTQLAYVESHGTEYIDTGIVPTATTAALVDYQFLNVSPSTYAGVFGSFATNKRFSIMVSSAGLESFGIGTGYFQQTADTQRKTVLLDNQNTAVELNGTAVSATSGTFTAGRPGSSLLIFAYRASNGTIRPSVSRVYGVELSQGGELQHKLVPVKADATGEYGLYDLIGRRFLGNASGRGALTGPDVPAECTVTLTAPTGVTVKVYGGFADGGARLTAVSSSTADGIVSYVYALPAGEYHFVSNGTGYHTLHKDFIVTVQDLIAGAKTVNADSGAKTLGGSYQSPVKIYSYSDELFASPLMDISGLTARFPDLLDTPAFAAGKGKEEYTTQAELAAYLQAHALANDNMYLYEIGTTELGKTVYLSLHTTLAVDASDLEAAAAQVQADARPTIFLEAQIHGNEPGGGEGALALINQLCGDYGDEVLQHVNIVILPRVNGDGAEAGIRQNSQGVDMNRDHMRVRFVEVRNAHEAYNLFMPEVAITAHEANIPSAVLASSNVLCDFSVGSNPNMTQTAAFNELNEELLIEVIRQAYADGFRARQYGSSGGSRGPVPSADTSYFRMRGSLTMLTESTGIFASKETFFRRVASQFEAFSILISFVIDNSDEIVEAVAAERRTTVEKGATFEEDDVVVLRHGDLKAVYTFPMPTYSVADGSVVNAGTKASLTFCKKPEKVRSRATAYLIPADIAEIETVLDIAASHGIEFYALGAEDVVLLRQYSGTITDALLGDESEFVFPNGAYVFPMNQVSGTLLSTLMEPDFYDDYGDRATFVQLSLIPIDSVYRCEQDLVNGRIPLENAELPPETGVTELTGLWLALALMSAVGCLAILPEKKRSR